MKRTGKERAKMIERVPFFTRRHVVGGGALWHKAELCGARDTEHMWWYQCAELTKRDRRECSLSFQSFLHSLLLLTFSLSPHLGSTDHPHHHGISHCIEGCSHDTMPRSFIQDLGGLHHLQAQQSSCHSHSVAHQCKQGGEKKGWGYLVFLLTNGMVLQVYSPLTRTTVSRSPVAPQSKRWFTNTPNQTENATKRNTAPAADIFQSIDCHRAKKKKKKKAVEMNLKWLEQPAFSLNTDGRTAKRLHKLHSKEVEGGTVQRRTCGLRSLRCRTGQM
jgi:hypothetical protein